MAQRYVVAAAAFTLSTTAKTAVNIIAGANNPFTIIEIGASVNALTGMCLVELFESTQGAAGTTTSTGVKQIGGYSSGTDGTPYATYGHNYSAEPTTLTVLKMWRFPCPGPFVIQFPLGREPWSLLSGSTNHKALGIRLTIDTGSPTSDSYVEFEE
jgi:hypothetical protein